MDKEKITDLFFMQLDGLRPITTIVYFSYK